MLTNFFGVAYRVFITSIDILFLRLAVINMLDNAVNTVVHLNLLVIYSYSKLVDQGC
ncbi:hypothetical protein DSUL_60303 [Desulfovibrionales bacterium]